MSVPAVVKLRDVRKAFAGVPVLQGVDLRLAPGESYTLLGGSGSGKSVCLKHIVGLLQPDAGSVAVFGRELLGLRDADLVDTRRRIGTVFQSAALFDSLSVLENVAYPLREHRDWPEERVAARVAECLESVGLPGIEAKSPAELSGGMRKRVGIARAIALAPELILYDEPTMGLDPANARRVGGLIRSLQSELRASALIVTHDMPLCFAVSDRVGMLLEGRIGFEGTVDELRGAQAPELRAFLDWSGERGTA
jgi:phospholipid/cholesterol/gamma-HCH transport system ATP-binding protein